MFRIPRRSFLLTLAAALTALAVFSSAPAMAAGKASPAAAFVQKLGDTALMSLTEQKLSRTEREKRVRNILRTYFDVNAIGKFALGPYWREATEKERKEYLSLFENMIVQTYTTRFEEYSGQTLEVSSAVESGGGHTLVSSKVVQKDGPPIALEWRVRGNKVLDVVVEGVSMSVTQRSEFSAIIQRGGGTVESLLASLRERKDAKGE